MPSTKTIQDTITWSASFLEQQPVLINGLQPALDSAQLVLQTILGPPFSWPWNRGIVVFTTSNQDTTQASMSNFGFLEGGTVQPISGGKAFEVAVKQILHIDTNTARPQWASAYIDDGLGNITFRLTPAPDQSYLVTLPFQLRTPLLLSLAYTWAPVPDDKYYICQWGFLSLMSLIGNDARFSAYNQKFVTSLLAAQGGLSDLERNIFLANWTRVLSQVQGTQLATAERYKAREV